MLEAVNSVLSNASYTKAAAEQLSVANSFAANPQQIQRAPIQAPYVSLYIKVDVNFDKALLQLRDPDTGDVVRQIPSEVQLEAYRRAQQVVAPKISQTQTSQQGEDIPAATFETSETTTAETSAPVVRERTSVETSAPAPSAPAPVSIDTEA